MRSNSATCGVGSRRVPCREFASAALQECTERAQGDTRRPPASERLAPGPRRARSHAPAPAHRHATRHAPPPTLVRPAAGSRTTRLSMCSVRCVARSGQAERGAARTAAAGRRSCALRHASVSTLSCVLPQPAICRDVLGRAARLEPGAQLATRALTPHCDGVNALQLTPVTSELNTAELFHLRLRVRV